jgi:aspartate carbamoyltransferase catalytic subunit
VVKLEEALDGADVIIVLRLQRERQAGTRIPSPAEYAAGWGVTTERLRLAQPDALFLHPMPINRGLEVESAVADGSQSAIFRQVRHGVAVRMAILYLILAGG